MQPVAGRSVADYRAALRFMHPRSEHWQVPVEAYSALEGAGTAKVWDIIQQYQTALSEAGEIKRNRAHQAKTWMWSEVTDELIDNLKSDPDVKAQVKQLEKKVTDGKLSPTVAAQQLIATFLRRSD
jgi:LAO/AO transport system kinase